MAISFIISTGLGSPSDIPHLLTRGLGDFSPVTVGTGPPAVISQGIGSPSGIPYFLTLGLGDFGTSIVAPPEGFVYPDVFLQMVFGSLTTITVPGGAAVISQGLGSPSNIPYFLTLGLGAYGTTTIEDPDAWTDVDDIRSQEPVIVEYGIIGNTPSDRIANTGKLTFSLDNSEHNSAGQLGYYSTLNALHRTGFALNVPVRLALSCASVDLGAPYYKFRGRLDVAQSDSGELSDRMTHCSALDQMDDWSTVLEPDLDPQLDRRSDQVLTSILDALSSDMQPPARSIETGLETYPYALDGGTGQRLSIRDRLNQIALSEFGKMFFKGDTTQGGTFAFQNRHHAPLNTIVLFDLEDDIALDGLSLETYRSNVYRSVAVTIHPVTVDAVETVLYSLTSTRVFISSGEVSASLFGPYRDPDTHEQIGGRDFVGLFPGYDYTLNSAEDGSGTDLTAYLNVTFSATGSGVRWILQNHAPIGGWAWVQLRGKAIRRSLLELAVTVPGGFGRQVLTFDMPYQSDANIGTDVAEYLATLLATPSAQIASVRFLANRTVDHMAAALRREPGDRVMVSEIVNGITDSEAMINGVRLELEQGGEGVLVWCTWFLDAISATHYWLAGLPGSSEAGVTTIPGI